MEQPPTRIYALGPEGTFSHKAAEVVRARFAPAAVPLVFTRTIPEVLARSEAEEGVLGIIPIENSVAGTVAPAQDGLASHRLTIVWEIALPVRFSLAADGPPERVEVYFAHPQAFDQCSTFLAAKLPRGQVSFTNSNTESAEKLLQHSGGAPAAAIVPHDYGRAHPELVVAEDIQDFPDNTTRFLVTRRAVPGERHDLTRKKTSLLIVPEKDYPGLLHDLLTIFHKHAINLIRLESRPFKVTPWTYVFYIDIDNNANSEACLADLQTTPNEITVLGSYDRLE